ncbi:hypothetical protein AREALGSMS7_00611 [Arenibacter algicola]|uniref:Uncharacterized protein n=1 Tax=Arenibacter algicola TaxID=616991 RepID=A0A221USB5_9FLAO|nr:hypothetical protein AREALGSMS7_00611 [Arenibacter algicola]
MMDILQCNYVIYIYHHISMGIKKHYGSTDFKFCKMEARPYGEAGRRYPSIDNLILERNFR